MKLNNLRSFKRFNEGIDISGYIDDLVSDLEDLHSIKTLTNNRIKERGGFYSDPNNTIKSKFVFKYQVIPFIDRDRDNRNALISELNRLPDNIDIFGDFHTFNDGDTIEDNFFKFKTKQELIVGINSIDIKKLRAPIITFILNI